MYVDIELDAIIEVAHQKRASDIHFDTTQLGLEVRFRCDGLLSRYETIDRAYQEQMINRIKVLSGMDISEKRIPQDGRCGPVDATAYLHRSLLHIPCTAQ